MFELWDTRNARLVGKFESEKAALDAAYRELRALAGPERPHLAVCPAALGAAGAVSGLWRWLPGGLRRAITPARGIA